MSSSGRDTVYLGCGSNLGDRAAELGAGLVALAADPHVSVLAVSGVFESAYVGPGEAQNDYLNTCAAVETDLEPVDLLRVLKGIERVRGRRGETHMRPRTLDLDILLYGRRTVDSPELTIPHPGLEIRAFVLEPLADLAPDLVLPDSGQTVARRCAMIRAAEGRTAHRRPDINLSAIAAEEL